MLDLSAKISSFRKMVWSNEKRKSEKELYECRVIGYSEYLTIQVLIIEVNNEIHKVLAAFFKEMQRTAKQFLDLRVGGSIWSKKFFKQ